MKISSFREIEISKLKTTKKNLERKKKDPMNIPERTRWKLRWFEKIRKRKINLNQFQNHTYQIYPRTGDELLNFIWLHLCLQQFKLFCHVSRYPHLKYTTDYKFCIHLNIRTDQYIIYNPLELVQGISKTHELNMFDWL